jgi:predicted membrane protein
MIFFDFTHATEVLQSDQKEIKSRVLPYLLFYGNVFLSIYYSMNIKFGTKFIIALCDVFKKIVRTRRFYFENTTNKSKQTSTVNNKI